MKLFLSFLILIMITNSCDSSKKTIESKNTMQTTLSETYSITQIENNSSFSNTLSIAFDSNSNSVSGFTGCNSFFGSYTSENNTIKFSAIGASKKYCQKDINTIEQQLLKTLTNIDAFDIKGDVIAFYANEILVLKGITIANTGKK